jgi:F-type H+-transporting ATPase subunit b
MPQFDPAVFLPQIFWLVICFTGLYVFTIGYSMPRLRKAYDQRWQHIEGTRIEAVKIHRQAQDITAAFEKELDNARKKASHHVNTRMHRIAQATTDEKNEIMADMKKQFMKAELRLTQRKMESLVDAQLLAEMLSTEIVLKLMRDRITSKSVRTMVTQSFKNRAVNAR